MHNEPIEVVVVGLHLRWHGVWQRPNHILSRVAERAHVIVVEEESPAVTDGQRVVRSGGVTVVTPERVRPEAGVDRTTIRFVNEMVAGRSALLWLYSPMMLDLCKSVPEAPIVYDKMDELAAFKYADPSLAARELEVCDRAVYVFAGGRSLWESVRDRVRLGDAYPSGVDVAAYAAAARAAASTSAAAPAPDTPCGKPIFGYIGVIDERIDLELIAQAARARPDASFTLAGPVAKIAARDLPRASNIAYLGKLAYTELPALVASFSVALMPFARNDATRYISPTKTLEYLAAERPVVSTAVPDVVADFGDIVYVANDAEEFIAALLVAQRGDPVRRSAGATRAAAMTWDAIVQRMIAGLARADIRFSSALQLVRS